MHKSMKKLVLAGAAVTFALTPAMVAAQDMSAPDAATDPAAPAAETMAEDPRMTSLPADKQDAIKAWPAETQTYYWSLTQERQQMFWALSDADKVTLSKMPEAQRESTWAQIESSMAATPG